MPPTKTNNKMEMIQKEPFVMQNEPAMVLYASFKQNVQNKPYESGTLELRYPVQVTGDMEKDEAQIIVVSEWLRGLTQQMLAEWFITAPQKTEIDKAVDAITDAIPGIVEEPPTATTAPQTPVSYDGGNGDEPRLTSKHLAHALWDLWRDLQNANKQIIFGGKTWPSGEEWEVDSKVQFSFWKKHFNDVAYSKWDQEQLSKAFSLLNDIAKAELGKELVAR